MENEETKLNSSLKTRHIVMLSLGGAIGSGLFVGSGSVMSMAGPSAILAYVLAGLMLFVVMYGVGRMVVYGDVKEAGMSGIIKPYVGARWAHFTDWVYWSCWMAVLIAEQAGVSVYLGMLFPDVPAKLYWIFALIVAVLATAINLYSVRAFAETEYWLAFVKVAVIIILIGLGLYLLVVNDPHLGFTVSAAQKSANTSMAPSFMPHGLSGLVASLMIVIFSFGGSELAAVTVAETENPKVAIPKAIRGVLIRIISFYVIPIFLFLQLLPWSQVSGTNQESPFATIFKRIGIPDADKVVLVVIVIAIFSAVNSAIYATSRSLYSRMLESQGRIGQYLGQVSKKQVPMRAIYVSSAILFLGVLLTAAIGENFWVFVANSISFSVSIVWIILLIAAIIMYFKRAETGNWFLKIVTPIVLVVLVAIFVWQVKQSLVFTSFQSWGVLVFALIICLASFFSYRKPKK